MRIVLAGLASLAPQTANADVGTVLEIENVFAPGTMGPITALGTPTVNDEGAAAFVLTYEDPSVVPAGTNTQLAVYHGEERLTVITAGDLLPDSVSNEMPVPVAGFGDHRIAANRDVVFRGESGASTLNGLYIWDPQFDGGMPTKIVFNTDLVETAPDEDTRFGQIATTRHGEGVVLWLAELTGQGGRFNKAVLQHTFDGPPEIVGRVSDDAPAGVASDAVIADIFAIAGNEPGNFAYTAEIDIPSDPGRDVRALIVDGAIVHHTGDTAPGFSASFTGFEAPKMNDAGDVLYIGRLDDIRGLFVYSGGESTALTAEGDPAINSGGASIAAASINRESALISAAGDVAFLATVEGPNVDATNDQILYYFPLGDRTNIEIIARKGEPAPGLEDGVVFAELGEAIQPMAMNAAGNVLFTAELAGPGVTLANDNSLWRYEAATGELHKVIRDGDVVHAAGFDFNVLDFRVQLGSGGEDGERVGYSASGWIGLWTDLRPLESNTPQEHVSVLNIDDPDANDPGTDDGGSEGGEDTGEDGGATGGDTGGDTDGDTDGEPSDDPSGGGRGCSVGGGAGGSAVVLGVFALGLIRRRRR